MSTPETPAPQDGIQPLADSATPSLSILSPAYRLTTTGIVSLVALMAFEALAVATAMPAVARALGGVAWYAMAFGITVAASVVGMTAAGGWCDARGPAAPLWWGLGCFVLGLLLAGCAPAMPVFLAGRLVQGLGAGGMSVALYVLVARRYPQGLRRRIFAAFATAWVVPALVGPAISGLVVELLGWRWVFLGVPLLALLAAALLRGALAGLSGHGQAVPGGVRRNLWALGAATGIGLLYLGGQGQGAAATGLLLGAAALALVCTWKLLPAGTLRAGRGLPSVMALRGLAFAAFFGAEAFLPLLLSRERGLSAPAAGLVLSAGALGWCSASWYQGHSRNGWSRHRFLRLGTSALLAGVVLTASAAWRAVPVGVAVAGWVVAGLGMGLLSASLSVLTLSLSAPGQQGANSSALQLSEAIAVAATLAIGGALFSAWLEVSAPLAYLGGLGVAAAMAVLAACVVERTGTRQVFVA